MNDTVEEIVKEWDKETKEMGFEMSLHLIGSPDSRFLKGIAGRCKKLGLLQTWFPDGRGRAPGHPTIVDEETASGKGLWVPGEEDIDCLYHEGISATARAVYTLLRRLHKIEGKHICIVGRGHAVKGLAELLVNDDATVTVCHTKTKSLGMSAFPADIIINSAPDLGKENSFMVSGTDVIDISGALTGDEYFADSYIGPRDIGRLTTSVLLHRATLYYE